MSEVGRCPQCGCEVTVKSSLGVCVGCLLKAGLEEPSQALPNLETVSAAKSSGRGFVPPTPEQLVGLIPNIEIIELLGRGGMGAVYKARQKSLDRLVAVKLLPPDIGHDPAFTERFAREARALGRLNHPNIVAIHDTGHSDGLYYFVMEFVDGANLRYLLNEGAFAAKDVLAIVPQVCEALQYAHEQGIVHRDIKPENILIDKKGRVKIADFGLAKLLGEEHLDNHLTTTNQIMGTIKYMAPEQMEGARDIDHRADIYSLGVVFYELLTGELPLGRFAPPSKKVQIDVRLDEIVLRALEKEPKQRYQQAGDVKTEVESVVRTPARPVPPPIPIATPPVAPKAAPPVAQPVPPQVAQPAAPQAAQPEEVSFFKLLRKWGADFDEVESPYLRRVVLPVVGAAAFWLVLVALARATGHVRRGEELVSGLFTIGFAFAVMNVGWLLRLWIRGSDGPWPKKWTPEQVENRLQLAARRLKLTGLVALVGWLALVPYYEWYALAAVWGIVTGSIILIAARSLARGRDPGTLALLLAMVPLSPAVVLGLPVGLYLLRILGRPEVRAYFVAEARERAGWGAGG